jgi:hypothetical protein
VPVPRSRLRREPGRTDRRAQLGGHRGESTEQVASFGGEARRAHDGKTVDVCGQGLGTVGGVGRRVPKLDQRPFLADVRSQPCPSSRPTATPPDPRFLDHLETDRSNSPCTWSARLGAIHSFMRYVAVRDPRR